jgi:4-amino-4-deoxy-L-arabinose transferase-like glycosyltransferase
MNLSPIPPTQNLAGYLLRPWILLSVVAIWLAGLAWLRPFTLPDEGRYAGVAWEMLSSESYLVPLINGMPYFHKPPLYYWLAQASFFVFGVNEWAARLPSLLLAWIAIAAMYAFVRHYRDSYQATWVALILATLPLYYGGAQFANLDMTLASMLTLCMLAGASTALRAENGKPYRAMSLATTGAAALAVLAKGLVGIVLPAATLFLWLMLGQRWRAMRALLWPPAILVFAVIAAPWFWLMQQRYPGFFHYFFIYQHFQRFAASGFNNVQPVWFYLPVIIGLTMPWMLWVKGMLHKSFWIEGAACDLRRLMIIWVLVVVGFFSVPSSKLIGYVLPSFPPLAFLLSEVVTRVLRNQECVARQRLVRITLAAALVICVLTVGIAAFKGHRNAKYLGRAIHAELRRGDTLIALHAYPFDLRLHARVPTPIWVIDDWQNPDIAVRDSWRKELYDAALFDPQVGGRVLLSDSEFQVRLCAAPENSRYWIYGVPRGVQQQAVLNGVQPWLQDGKNVVWLLQTDAAFKVRVCGEML